MGGIVSLMRVSKRVFSLKTFSCGIHLYAFLDRQSQFWSRMGVDIIGEVFVTEISTRQMKKKRREIETNAETQPVCGT